MNTRLCRSPLRFCAVLACLLLGGAVARTIRSGESQQTAVLRRHLLAGTPPPCLRTPAMCIHPLASCISRGLPAWSRSVPRRAAPPARPPTACFERSGQRRSGRTSSMVYGRRSVRRGGAGSGAGGRLRTGGARSQLGGQTGCRVCGKAAGSSEQHSGAHRGWVTRWVHASRVHCGLAFPSRWGACSHAWRRNIAPWHQTASAGRPAETSQLCPVLTRL